MTSTMLNAAKREAAPWIERLARFGYASVGTVYAIVGFLAVIAATGRRQAPDQSDAFAFVLEKPLGKLILIVVGAGLLGYAGWRLICGFADAEQRGRDAKGLALRVGSIIRGLLYLGISMRVFQLALRNTSGSGSDAKAHHWTATAMAQPFGRWAAGIAGVLIIGAGIYQLAKAWRAKLSSQLNLGSAPLHLQDKIIAVSRFGIAARGIVFLVIGWSVVQAAIHFSPQAAQGTSGALQQLSRPFGGALLIAVGFGLIAFGVYGFVNARYRRIHA